MSLDGVSQDGEQDGDTLLAQLKTVTNVHTIAGLLKSMLRNTCFPPLMPHPNQRILAKTMLKISADKMVTQQGGLVASLVMSLVPAAQQHCFKKLIALFRSVVDNGINWCTSACMYVGMSCLLSYQSLTICNSCTSIRLFWSMLSLVNLHISRQITRVLVVHFIGAQTGMTADDVSFTMGTALFSSLSNLNLSFLSR